MFTVGFGKVRNVHLPYGRAERKASCYMKIIAIANQKGGVAKTTTAINLASGLAMRGSRTLLVDLDAQANATQSLPSPTDAAATIYEVFNQELSIAEAIYTVDDNFDALASHIGLAKLEPQLQGAVDAYRLREVLEGLPYDYVVVDCPPSLGALTTNALVAATHVLVPVTASYYGLNAVADFIETFERIRKIINTRLKLLGVVVTIYDSRLTIAKDVVTVLRETYGDDVFKTVIHKNVRLDEAASDRSSIFNYDPTSRGAADYQSLLEEVLVRAST